MIIQGTTYEGKLLNVFIKDVLHSCCQDFRVCDSDLRCRYEAFGPDTWMLYRALEAIAEHYGIQGEIVKIGEASHRHYQLRVPLELLAQFPPQPFVPPAPRPRVEYTPIIEELPF